jgi:hypothetical protein
MKRFRNRPIRNPQYAPEFLERKLSPSGLDLTLAADVSSPDPAPSIDTTASLNLDLSSFDAMLSFDITTEPTDPGDPVPTDPTPPPDPSGPAIT